MRLLAFGAMALATALAGRPEAAVAEPVDYVRVCDAFGTGFFYIPGTETCLHIGGRVTTSWADTPGWAGGGTVVRSGGGPELPNTSVESTLRRWGGEAGFEYGVDSDSFPDFFGPNTFLWGNLAFAFGEGESKGRSEIGPGTSFVGLTFLEWDPMYGTGVGAGSAGFGLRGWSKAEQAWGLTEFGVGSTFFPGGDGSSSVAIVNRFGVYFEGSGFDAKGANTITFDGMRFGNYRQRFDLTTRDYYAGFNAGLDFVLQPVDRLQITFGGTVYVGHHWGEGHVRSVTGVGGTNVVIQERSFSEDGFVLGGALKLDATYRIAPNWTVGMNYAARVMPQATAIYMPQNPGGQPVHANGENQFSQFLGVSLTASWP